MKYHLYWSLKSSCFEFFGDEKYGILWAKKLCYDMIFTNYWKDFVLNFLVMENTVFFWDKRLMERWFLMVTETFLLWTFRWWEIRSFFLAKKLMERWYLLGLFELSTIFYGFGNGFFVQWVLHMLFAIIMAKSKYIHSILSF